MKPKLGVVYHYKDEAGLEDAVRKEYEGPLIIASDLMVINVCKTVTWNGKSSTETIRGAINRDVDKSGASQRRRSSVGWRHEIKI